VADRVTGRFQTPAPPEMEILKVNDPVLTELLEPKLRLIYGYSSPLFLDKTLVGSGTFIAWNDQFGILTAHHVPHNPLDSSLRFNFSASSQQRLGLALVEFAHCFEFEMRNLSLVNIAAPVDSEDPGRGPDLAVIKLGNKAVVEAIAARKLFYRLDVRTFERLECSLRDDGIFVICGAAKECEQTGGPELGFTEVMTEALTTYYGGMVPPSGRRFQQDGYHYAELGVEYATHDGLPGTFGGVSGGGLWRIEVSANAQGRYTVSDPVLAGVAFYQTAVVDDQRKIRCHAGDAIYTEALNQLI